MSSIQAIARVTAATGTASRPQTPFGYPMAFALFAGGSQLKPYASIAEVALDHTSSTAPYKMAAAMFAQLFPPSRIYIGRRSTEVAAVRVLTLSTDLITGNVYSATVNGTVVSVTYATSHTVTLGTMATAIEALGSVLTAVSNAGARTITITGDLADPNYGGGLSITGEAVTLGASQPTVTDVESTPLTNAETDLNTLANNLGASSAWYAFVTDLRTDTRIQLISSWAATNKRLYVWQSDTAGLYDADSTTDVGYVISAAAEDWSVGIYYTDDTLYLDAAVLGGNISIDLDNKSGIWRYFRVVGFAYNNLTTAQEAALTAKNVNYYSELETGYGAFQEGVTGSGRKIDERVGLDWIKRRSEEAIAGYIISASVRQSKIPFTDDGINALTGAGLGVLMKAVRTGFLSDDADRLPFIIAPRASAVSDADKAARRLSFSGYGYLAGAIESVLLFDITLEV